jgi:hypothetical protein
LQSWEFKRQPVPIPVVIQAHHGISVELRLELRTYTHMYDAGNGSWAHKIAKIATCPLWMALMNVYPAIVQVNLFFRTFQVFLVCPNTLHGSTRNISLIS